MDLSKYGIIPVSKQTSYPTFLYFGPAKSGKSSAALTHSNPLVFDSDKGSYELGVLPPGVGRAEAARDFPICDVGGDISVFIDTFESMDRDGFFSNKEPAIDSLVFDSSTRIYESIKNEYIEERDARGKDDSIFEQKIRLDEYGMVKRPLRKIMSVLMHAPYVKVHIMQEAVVFKKNARGQMEADGSTTFKGEAGIIYDASVIVRTFVEKGRFRGEVIYDRTHTYNPGQLIDNPGWKHWEKFYRGGGVEDPRVSTIRAQGNMGEKTISSKVDALMADPEILSLFAASGIPQDLWQMSCEKYNGDRNMIVGKLKEKINGLSNQPQ